jgi:hypothetical protein
VNKVEEEVEVEVEEEVEHGQAEEAYMEEEKEGVAL